MKTRNLNLIKFSFFTALLLMISCENKSLGERQREADSIEKAKNNPTKSAQDELNESYNKRMNSKVVKEINECHKTQELILNKIRLENENLENLQNSYKNLTDINLLQYKFDREQINCLKKRLIKLSQKLLLQELNQQLIK